MSLILDALKKSEQERRRERGPDLQSIHRPMMTTAAPTRRNSWLLVGAAVLVLNGAGLAWWLLRSADGNGVAVPMISQDAPPDVTQPVASIAPAPSRAVTPPAAQTPPVAQMPPAASTTARVPATTSTDAFSDPEFTSMTPGAVSEPSSTPVQELSELPEPIRRNLPPMTYSFHVYSSDPQRRTIIINNRRLREGEQVSEDLVLEEITSDGVILATAGYRVHIAVLGEW